MTTFSTDNTDILTGLGTPVGARYNDATRTVLDAAGLTASRAMIETGQLGSRNNSSTVFEDIYLNLTDLPVRNSRGTTIGATDADGLVGGSIVFRRCTIVLQAADGLPTTTNAGQDVLDAVWGGGSDPVNASNVVPITFEDCFIDAPTGRAAVFNARQWRVSFVRTRVSNRVLLQLPFGTPLAGITISATRDDPGRLTGSGTSGQLLTYSARVVNALPGNNTGWMPLFDFRDTAGTPGGFNYNFNNTGTLSFYNPVIDLTTTPVEDITLSLRNSFSGNSTSRFSQLYHPTLVNSSGQAITGDTTFFTPLNTLWHLVPPSYVAGTAIPTVTTADNLARRTITFGGTQPMAFYNETIELTSGDRTTVANAIETFNTVFQPIQLKASRHGFRRFDSEGTRITIPTSATAGTAYAADGSLVLPTDNSPNVTLLDSFYNSTDITEARLNAITAGSTLNYPDEAFAYSDKLNEVEDLSPWEVDETATVGSANATTERPANPNAATAGTWWRLKSGISLTITNVGEYTENISVNSEGNFSGTITIPISSTWSLMGGRPIRLDGGRVATYTGVTPEQAGLDTVIIDDYEPAAAATTLTVRVSQIPAGIVWRVYHNGTLIPGAMGTGMGTDIVLSETTTTTLTTAQTVLLYTGRDTFTNLQSIIPDDNGMDNVLTPAPLSTILGVPASRSTTIGLDVGINLNSTGLIPLTISESGLDSNNSVDFVGWNAEVADSRASQEYLNCIWLQVAADSTLIIPDTGVLSHDAYISTPAGPDFRIDRVFFREVLTEIEVIPGGRLTNDDQNFNIDNPERTLQQQLDTRMYTTEGANGEPQVIFYPRVADRIATVNNEQTLVNTINTRGRRTALGIP